MGQQRLQGEASDGLRANLASIDSNPLNNTTTPQATASYTQAPVVSTCARFPLPRTRAKRASPHSAPRLACSCLPPLTPLLLHAMSLRGTPTSAESWLLSRVGETPQSSVGWFRAGVGFYNKKEFALAIDCMQRSTQIDPLNVRLEMSGRDRWYKDAKHMCSLHRWTPLYCTAVPQYNAFQIMARACIAVNRS